MNWLSHVTVPTNRVFLCFVFCSNSPPNTSQHLLLTVQAARRHNPHAVPILYSDAVVEGYGCGSPKGNIAHVNIAWPDTASLASKAAVGRRSEAPSNKKRSHAKRKRLSEQERRKDMKWFFPAKDGRLGVDCLADASKEECPRTLDAFEAANM